MEAKRRIMTAAAVATVAVMACSTGAQINIALHEPNDPAPRRVEIGAQVAGLCLGFLLSWSRDGAQPAARG
jgi:hypothetical protein